MNKILRLGCLFFSLVLLVFGILRIMSGRESSGVFYIIAAIGFYIIYYSYKRSHRKD